MKWYYALNNQRHGPVSENEFDFLVHQKKIPPNALVWNETMTDWRPLGEVLPEPAPEPPPYDWDAAQRSTPPAAPERNGPAWEDRDSIGGLNAAANTVMELLGNSDRAFTRMRRMGDWAGPFFFALFMGSTGYYANLFYNILLNRLNSNDLKGSNLLLSSNLGTGFLVVSAYFFIPVFVAFSVILGSALLHFTLVLMGGVKQPFQTTWRVVSYSFGASAVLQFIPLLGAFLAPVWTLILTINGIARMHEVSTGRAALAMVLVVFAVLFAGYFLVSGLGMV